MIDEDSIASICSAELRYCVVLIGLLPPQQRRHAVVVQTLAWSEQYRLEMQQRNGDVQMCGTTADPSVAAFMSCDTVQAALARALTAATAPNEQVANFLVDDDKKKKATENAVSDVTLLHLIVCASSAACRSVLLSETRKRDADKGSQFWCLQWRRRFLDGGMALFAPPEVIRALTRYVSEGG